MILALLLAQAGVGPAAPAVMSLRQCASQVRTAPQTAIGTANRWLTAGGGRDARLCLGAAYSAAEQWALAAPALEAAARETANAGERGKLYVQAGNAWLLASDPSKARAAFDRALAGATLAANARGEALLDRARAHAALLDARATRADLDAALPLLADKATALLLSASLAATTGDLPRARVEIARALALAPGDEAVKAEAQRIAGAAPPRPAPPSR